jgi:hypothetical protein
LSRLSDAKPGDDPAKTSGPPPAPTQTGAPPLAALPPPDSEPPAQAKPASRRRASSAAPEPPAGVAAAAPDLKVLRLVTARDVSGREPVGAATSFSAADLEKVYAFVELANDARAESGIVVTFTPPAAGPQRIIKLDVGPQKRWRTWAVTRKARAPGTWAVSVADARGTVLARTSFTVTE